MLATTLPKPPAPPPPGVTHDGRRLIKTRVHILDKHKERVKSLTGYSTCFDIIQSTEAMAHREKQKSQTVDKPHVTIIPYQNIPDCIEICNLLNNKCRTVEL